MIATFDARIGPLKKADFLFIQNKSDIILCMVFQAQIS